MKSWARWYVHMRWFVSVSACQMSNSTSKDYQNAKNTWFRARQTCTEVIHHEGSTNHNKISILLNSMSLVWNLDETFYVQFLICQILRLVFQDQSKVETLKLILKFECKIWEMRDKVRQQWGKKPKNERRPGGGRTKCGNASTRSSDSEK